jgi:hypothetical protein
MIEIQQEPDKVPRGLIRLATIVAVLSILGSIGATVLLGRGTLGELVVVESKSPARIERQPFQVYTEWEVLDRSSMQRLRGYGWVDRSRGIVHVPLEVATELYLGDRR